MIRDTHKNPPSNRFLAFKPVIAMLLIGLAVSFSTVSKGADDPLDILVVVNREVPVKNVSPETARDLFLKVKTHWSGTTKALAVNAADSTLRDAFRTRVLRMNRAEEERYWRDSQVRGNQREPVSFQNTLKAVYKLRGAISYVFRKDYAEGVAKVVLVVPASH